MEKSEILERIKEIKERLDINPDYKIWNIEISKNLTEISDKTDIWGQKIRFENLNSLNEQVFFNYKNLDRVIKFESSRLKQRKKYLKENRHNLDKETIKNKVQVIEELDQLVKKLRKIKRADFIKEIKDEIIKF